MYDKKANMNDNQKRMRLLMRDDGCIYTYNDAFAGKPNFREVKLTDDNEYVEVLKPKQEKTEAEETKFAPLTKRIEEAKAKQEVKIELVTAEDSKKALKKKYPSMMNKNELKEHAMEKYSFDFKGEMTKEEMLLKIKNLEKRG